MKNSNFIAKYIQGDRQQPKQRLQFPIAAQQRKHFEYAPREQIRISHDNNEFFLKDARRDNNLDVSNIEGAKPRISVRTRSQRHITEGSSHVNVQYQDQLDHFAKIGLHKRDLSMKQLTRINTENTGQKQHSNSNIAALQSRKQELKKARQFSKHLKTEPSQSDKAKDILDKYKIIDNNNNQKDKRSILKNPTYLSSLFFA